MKKFNIVFCVLTYKNHTDLLEFISGLEENDVVNFSYKIIVVNNYADDPSLEKIREIAISNNCDFIESENKGYSNGNNLGVEYAKENYDYDYLVVCNPDTIIQKFDFNKLDHSKKGIIAPEIICLNNKRQNPMYFSYMPLSEKVVYFGFKNRSKFLLYSGIALNKISRAIKRGWMALFRKKETKVYSCHGSYIIFSRHAIEKLYPVFDDNIFLFCEESDLARKALKNNIDITFNKDIVILHKEDGSMNLSNKNLLEIQRDSYLYYYKKWNDIKG
ncbi:MULTISPECIES: glycosyltransferase family 2 protein [Bacillus]|uniref:glycosyltransferase family 2 protein n=1 Tax=Bacillus TaxID=1386 RepID=UPI00148F0001|nr:glycosyltransferase family 2 protein [Bacillus paranthracis]NOP80693.1 glycosyltransferase family 2 protein [Bacillus paranthracis]